MEEVTTGTMNNALEEARALSDNWKIKALALQSENAQLRAPRYFLFAWEDYKMGGGVRDFVGVFGSIEEAKAADRPYADRAQIALFDGERFTILLDWTSRVDFPNGDMTKPRETTGWFEP